MRWYAAIEEDSWATAARRHSTLLATLIGLVVLRTILYLHDVFYYHHIQRRPRLQRQLPPKYPTFFPYIGLGLPLAWDIRSAITRFTTYNKEATVICAPVIPGIKSYLYQDPLVIRKIWKQSHLLDFRPLATHFFVAACRMPYDAAALYLKDTTGTKASPAPGGEAENRHRVHRLLHESDRQGVAGRGLAPTLEAYVKALDALISERATEDWTDVDDFWVFVQDTVGVAGVDAIFGPKLLELYPDFISDFFEFDCHVPWLLKGVPHRKGKQARSRLLDGFGRWIKHARQQSSTHKRRGSEARTSWWGAEWTRYRHETFTSFFDDDAMAAHDLGVTWGAMGNTTPATLMALLHIVQDRELHERVRQRVDDIAGSTPLTEVPLRDLTSDTLLSGIYAETLRLYVTNFVPVINMHGDLDLGRWHIPQGSYGLVSAGIAQRNQDVWNTRQGAHPVDSFWVDRFIVDPADPESGPVRPEVRQKFGVASPTGASAPDKPYFSTEGLDGSWIPFGGGKNMCPGRFMAKGIMAFTMALLMTKLDIELKVDSVRLGTDRFGMGIELPRGKIPFRVRKRRAQGTL